MLRPLASLRAPECPLNVLPPYGLLDIELDLEVDPRLLLLYDAVKSRGIAFSGHHGPSMAEFMHDYLFFGWDRDLPVEFSGSPLLRYGLHVIPGLKADDLTL